LGDADFWSGDLRHGWLSAAWKELGFVKEIGRHQGWGPQ
jgi:hypothetical protein